MSAKRCTIVGGSLSALFTALILKHHGYTITILERALPSSFHHQGAGIVASPDVQSFFAAHARTRTPLAVISPLRQYLDRNGAQIDAEHRTQKMTSWDLVYHVLRSGCDGEGGEYCDAPERRDGDGMVKYLMGKKVTEVTDAGEEGVEVVYMENDGEKGEHEVKTTTPLLIAADGPSSTIRRLLLPEVERTYTGYVAWRGTVVESELGEETLETFVEKFSFYHAAGLQILAYAIPGEKGTLERGKRLVNWVWYCNYKQDSKEYEALMTDGSGHTHQNSISGEVMAKEVWARQKGYAEEVLPPQFADLVCRTKIPFVQAITDVEPSKASFFDGKLLMVGDAFAGFRPHTAASTGQAARHAILLDKYLKRELNLRGWEQELMSYGRDMQRHGVSIGNRSQFGEHPLAQ